RRVAPHGAAAPPPSARRGAPGSASIGGPGGDPGGKPRGDPVTVRGDGAATGAGRGAGGAASRALGRAPRPLRERARQAAEDPALDADREAEAGRGVQDVSTHPLARGRAPRGLHRVATAGVVSYGGVLQAGIEPVPPARRARLT